MTHTQPWHEHVRFETDTKAEATKARRMTVIAVGLAALAAAGVAIAVLMPSFLGWVLLAVAGLASLFSFYLAGVTRKMSALTGDELIDVIVADEGIVGPGGLKIPWPEIASIDFVGIDMTIRQRPGVVPALAQQATNAALERADLGSRSAVVLVRLRDFDAVASRATNAVQRNVLTPPKGVKPGTVLVPLGARRDDELDSVITALGAGAAANDVPLTQSPA